MSTRPIGLLALLAGALLIVIVASACAADALRSHDQSPPADQPALLSQADIAALPAQQRAAFDDPRWTAAPEPLDMGTPLPAPTAQQLAMETSNALAHPLKLSPPAALGVPGLSRSASAVVGKGEYEFVAPAGVPPFGCNNDPSNSSNGQAVEDVINAAPDFLDPQTEAIDYVTQRLSRANHFNTTGGMGNDATSSVFQLFSSDRAADPGDPGALAEFGLLSYRADLAPGVGPGGDCSAATAYAVTGLYWQKFNSMLRALPAGAETEMYNLLIAPSGPLSDTGTSTSGTIGRHQPFYFGTVSAAYGGGWLFGLESSTSSCEDFNQFVAEAQTTGFFVQPIYGVLLKRWQQTRLAGMTDPWAGRLGWPVYGPSAYANGSAVLVDRGVYFAWSMWFERGFMWWIDYDQNMYPNTPDEALVYFYSGANMYCNAGDSYFPTGPPVYYNDGGPLGGSFVINAPFNQRESRYDLALTDSGSGPAVRLAMHCYGYGGSPDAQLRYKYIVWSFGDGTYITDPTPFVDDTVDVTHVYQYASDYVVRALITDANDDTVMVYSLPLRVE